MRSRATPTAPAPTSALRAIETDERVRLERFLRLNGAPRRDDACRVVPGR